MQKGIQSEEKNNFSRIKVSPFENAKAMEKNFPSKFNDPVYLRKRLPTGKEFLKNFPAPSQKRTFSFYFSELEMRVWILLKCTHPFRVLNWVIASCNEFENRGSGWEFQELLKNELMIAIYKPLAAASCIPLPSKLIKKKAISNIKNEDQNFFLWCALVHLHLAQANANRTLENSDPPTCYLQFVCLFSKLFSPTDLAPLFRKGKAVLNNRLNHPTIPYPF
ncbi:hypothetical protein TNIN_197121 [Trichonephila inaurata madagascariensis]|uniref:Uncharacterized protein n=1 Tax=Trichonephila inaurata madagascariensis TaxID=2747483 RepID=A0A8X7CES7_9ARAC|nr:hypothetical protein TNIN_197121 [Trichonephila inaurata madagascariensis]